MTKICSEADFQKMVEGWHNIQPPLEPGCSATYRMSTACNPNQPAWSIKYTAPGRKDD